MSPVPIATAYVEIVPYLEGIPILKDIIAFSRQNPVIAIGFGIIIFVAIVAFIRGRLYFRKRKIEKLERELIQLRRHRKKRKKKLF